MQPFLQDAITRESMLSLFQDNQFLDKHFPVPQYLGSKYVHRAWIAQYIPEEANSVLDAFAGSQSIAYLCKQLGKKVYCNDFLNCNYQIGKALIENQHDTLTPEDIQILFSGNSSPDEYSLMENVFTNIFFKEEDARFIDAVRSNVRFLSTPYKQSLALTIMNRSLTRKVTMGHFAHTQALNYAENPERIKRNRSLIRPVKEIFLSLIKEYNAAIFDNGQENKSYCANILDLLPSLPSIDLAYFDPPYCDSHADYQSFYHLLETYTEYWKDKQFVNGTKRYEPKRYSGFDLKAEATANMQKLFEQAKGIPTWIISYNDRSYPDIDTMIQLIEPYKKVQVERKVYLNGRGGKGSVAGSSEVLLICSNK